MEEPDFEKCAQEVNEMLSLPPASIEVSRVGLFAIITLIQAAVQMQPEFADDGWAKIGIAAARQLQKDLFNQDSEAHKVLEFGWNPEAYIVTPSVIAGMLQNIEGRRSQKHKSSRIAALEREEFVENADDASLIETANALLAQLQTPASISQVVPSDQI